MESRCCSVTYPIQKAATKTTTSNKATPSFSLDVNRACVKHLFGPAGFRLEKWATRTEKFRREKNQTLPTLLLQCDQKYALPILKSMG